MCISERRTQIEKPFIMAGNRSFQSLFSIESHIYVLIYCLGREPENNKTINKSGCDSISKIDDVISCGFNWNHKWILYAACVGLFILNHYHYSHSVEIYTIFIESFLGIDLVMKFSVKLFKMLDELQILPLFNNREIFMSIAFLE